MALMLLLCPRMVLKPILPQVTGNTQILQILSIFMFDFFFKKNQNSGLSNQKLFSTRKIILELLTFVSCNPGKEHIHFLCIFNAKEVFIL